MSSILKPFIIMLWMAQLQYLSHCQFFEELGNSSHNKMLTNHVRESLNTTAGLGDCYMTCAVREFCVSINYHHVTGVCDLNDATDKNHPDDMRNTSQVSYMTYSLRQPENKEEVTLVFPRKSIDDKVFWSNPFSPLQKFSLTLWVKADPATNTHAPFQYTTRQNNEEIAVHVWKNNNTYFMIRQSSLIINELLIDNKWHHLAMTWDSNNNGQLLAYIDGVHRGTKNVVAGQTIQSGGVLYLGQELDGYNTGFNSADTLQGKLTKVQMWSRVLSQAEVTSLASDRCNDTLVGNVIKWSHLVTKRSGQVAVEPCQLAVVLVFPRKSIEDKVFWMNPFISSFQVFSVSFWFLADPATDTHAPFQYNTQQNDAEIGVHVWRNNKNYFMIRRYSLIIEEVVIDNKWHHLAMTWDSNNNGQLLAYIDGVHRGTKSVVAGQTIQSGGGLYLGQDLDGYNTGFQSADALQGKLTQVNMWSRVLSQAEVTSLASHRCAGTLIGNLIKWPDLVTKRFGQVQIIEEPCRPFNYN